MTDPAHATGAHHAAVCDADTLARTALRHEAEEAGYEVTIEATNGAELLQRLELQAVRLVLLDQSLPGMTGMEVLATLRRFEAPPEVVLVADDLALRDHALDAGAWAVAPRGDTDAMLRILAEVRHFLDTGERRTHGDRRSGEDRRQKQDWSKVTSERRRGEDRRSGERREEGTAPGADDPARS